MVCKTKPVAQPGGSLPDLPVSQFEYNQLGEETKQTEALPSPSSASRTWTTGYDAAGRKTSEGISATSGSAVATATYGYNASSGLATTTSDGTRTITRAYDAVGRMTSYTDAEGQQSTTSYDLLSRAVVTNDGKGTQTRTYDTGVDARGLLTRIVDSQAGTFDATYDADGALATQSYPNNLTACSTYDETGDASRLRYVKAGCASPTATWLDDQQTSSIHGQWLSRQNSQLSSQQDYAYDAAGRLTLTKDTKNGACTTREYEYAGSAGKNSNRTKLTTRVSASSTCDTTSAGTAVTYGYDTADRESDTNFSYDSFGRTTQVPATHAGGSALSSTYYANDLLASVSQSGATRSYELDPARRVRQRTASDTTTQTYHYSDDSDAPSWTQDKPNGANPPYTRNVSGAGGDLVAQVVAGTTTLQLTNLHGDVVATASTSTTATGPSATFETDEFGVPRAGTPFNRYGYLGGKERRTELASGAIAMGVRLYVPQLGRFAQVDPVPGGSCNDYDYVCQDPANLFDLNGQKICIKCAWKKIPNPVKALVGAGLAVKKAWNRINLPGTLNRVSECADKLIQDAAASAGGKRRKDYKSYACKPRYLYAGTH